MIRSSLYDYFSKLSDPRLSRNKKHNLADILALKGNQSYLKEDVENLCKQMKPDSENEMVEKGHGRIETRNCKVYNQIHLLEDIEKWSDLKSVIQITSEREIN
ncbi:MAG: hypothetical protein Q7J06_04070, partial [Bacteroidales bacterium]|nr:hypothetical protein [Bacteroidales bacterium]